jgi:hypothetical protein
MPLSVIRAISILGLAVAAGCGDSTGVQPADLEGTWRVTDLVYTGVVGDVRVDVIVDFTATAVIVIEADGAFQMTITIGGDNDGDSGTLTVTGNEIEMDFGGQLASGTIARDGETVTIELDSGVEFDFDQNGTDDPAMAQLVMVKQ